MTGQRIGEGPIERLKTVLDVAIAVNFVQTHPITHQDYDSGVHAYFARLSPTWGLKFFFSSSERNENFRLQAAAHRHGLAPEVKSPFQATLPCGRTAYGYLTETIKETEKERISREKPNIYLGWEVMEEWRETSHDLDTLCYRLRKVGLTDLDMNWGNVGYVGKNLVCIDFSCEFFSVEKARKYA